MSYLMHNENSAYTDKLEYAKKQIKLAGYDGEVIIIHNPIFYTYNKKIISSQSKTKEFDSVLSNLYIKKVENTVVNVYETTSYDVSPYNTIENIIKKSHYNGFTQLVIYIPYDTNNITYDIEGCIFKTKDSRTTNFKFEAKGINL
jgi:hypothetical protein